MTIPRNLAHWVVEKCDLHYAWQSGKRLEILPFRNIIVVQVQKLQILQSCKYLSWRQVVKMVVREVYFLKVRKSVQERKIFYHYLVVL
jgi:hypothetical protein